MDTQLSYIELTDDMLSTIHGGSSGFGGLYELPKMNINTQINIGVAPQTTVTLWSKNVNVTGPSLQQLNFAFQS